MAIHTINVMGARNDRAQRQIGGEKNAYSHLSSLTEGRGFSALSNEEIRGKHAGEWCCSAQTDC